MKKTILALDVHDFKKAEDLVKKTCEYIDVYKIGPVLFLKFGQEIVKMIKGSRKEVFLDLKFYDIPSIVKRSVESARDLGVFSLTLHSIGGEEMLKAATSVEGRPKIWAVTVLTSQTTTQDEVLKRAEFAKSCGVDGVISSPLEISIIKKTCGDAFNVVTPGIRLIKAGDDQKRVTTPQAALRAGADFIVVGRPIIEAQDPSEVAKSIYKLVEGNV